MLKRKGAFGFATALCCCGIVSADCSGKLPEVKRIATGGTIAGEAATLAQVKNTSGGANVLIKLVPTLIPTLTEIGRVSGEQISHVGRLDMSDDVLLKLTRRINQLDKSDQVDGIAIIHVTDRMEETTYSSQFTLKTKKPVVLTGSMRSYTALSADRPLNIYKAVSLAPDAKAVGRGALVSTNDQLYSAHDIVNTHTTATEMLTLPYRDLIGATVHGVSQYYRHSFEHTSEARFNMDSATSLPKMDILCISEEMSGDLVDAATKADAERNVEAAVGDGNMPKAIMDPNSQPKPETKPSQEIYGFAMMDTGFDFKQVHPDWFDVVRPTKLPSRKNEFGADGSTYFSVRQTRFGAKSVFPTPLGPLSTIFEFELFGTGVDAGKTTFRLRHAYGELGQFGVGQTWSPFMDIDVFPNSVEYWGPAGMVFLRNLQFRWMPLKGDSRITFAVERPGASADQGRYVERIELQDVRPHFPAPDFSGEARLGRKWGYVRTGAILRRIEWVDIGTDQFDLSGGVWGWGINMTSNLRIHQDNVVKLAVVYGKGVQNYMNDAPADIGPIPNPGNTRTPLTGKPIPLLGIVGFYDHHWGQKWSSTIGYSRINIDNTSRQSENAFRTGQYALTNLLYYPVEGTLAGVEFQYGYRKNFRDGWSVPDYRIQLSFKYNFSFRLGG